MNLRAIRLFPSGGTGTGALAMAARRILGWRIATGVSGGNAPKGRDLREILQKGRNGRIERGGMPTLWAVARDHGLELHFPSLRCAAQRLSVSSEVSFLHFQSAQDDLSLLLI